MGAWNDCIDKLIEKKNEWKKSQWKSERKSDNFKCKKKMNANESMCIKNEYNMKGRSDNVTHFETVVQLKKCDSMACDMMSADCAQTFAMHAIIICSFL